MKKFWLVGLGLASVLAVAPAAKADTFNISYNSNALDGAPSMGLNGQVVISSVLDYLSGNTVIDTEVTSGTLSLDLGGAYYTATALASNAANQSAYGGYAAFDDIIAPKTSPYIDDTGLAFLVSNGSGDVGVLTLFLDDFEPVYNGSILWDEYVFSSGYIISPFGPDGTDAGGDPGSLDITSTPEPSSLLMLGTGLLCMAGFLFWKVRPSVVRAE
jgi:hypothetical protein